MKPLYAFTLVVALVVALTACSEATPPRPELLHARAIEICRDVWGVTIADEQYAAKVAYWDQRPGHSSRQVQLRPSSTQWLFCEIDDATGTVLRTFKHDYKG
jgi:hypothetical protein